jgi:hypothetical protein
VRVLSLCLIVIITLGAGFTSVSADPPPGATPGPALWKVEGGTAELYLFGTFHMLPGDLEWKNPAIDEAMMASGTLVLEADTDADGVGELIKKHAFNPPGKTLRSYFTKAEARRIDAALKPWGISIKSASDLRPWFVGLQVGMSAMLALGFDPAAGVEAVLLADAGTQSMALDYLETAEAGILALADHPDNLQAKLLLAMIEDLDTIEETMGQMILAWSTGDVEMVAEILNGNMARTPELIEAVLFKRNRDWVAPLQGLLESEGRYFVAVGAGHLAGPSSVIELLEAKGYQVVRQ